MDRAERAVALVELIGTLGHRCALVGGVAVSVRTRERFTKDIDFAVDVASDSESEQLAFELQERGFVLTDVVEQETKGVVATLRFQDPASSTSDPSFDILCASCGIEPEIVADSTLVELLPGRRLPVARVHHLIAMKVLSTSEVRDQDRADLRVLLAVATEEELQRAKAALRLIHERGFHRGKNLENDLDRLLRDRPETPIP